VHNLQGFLKINHDFLLQNEVHFSNSLSVYTSHHVSFPILQSNQSLNFFLDHQDSPSSRKAYSVIERGGRGREETKAGL